MKILNDSNNLSGCRFAKMPLYPRRMARAPTERKKASSAALWIQVTWSLRESGQFGHKRLLWATFPYLHCSPYLLGFVLSTPPAHASPIRDSENNSDGIVHIFAK